MKRPTLSSPPVGGTMPACEEKNWPTQLALDGAAACAEPVVATAAAIPAVTTMTLIRLTIERPPATQAYSFYDRRQRFAARRPAVAGRGDPRSRLLHRGDRVPEDALRLVLHRASDETGAGDGRHGTPRLEVDHPAGQEPLDRATARRGRVPPPRS